MKATFDEAVWQKWKDAKAAGNTKLVKLLESKLVEENVPLVRHLVMKQARYLRLDTDPDDLMQCGYLAFLRTLGSYDPSKGKFSTIMTWWVRHEIACLTQKEEHMPRPRGYLMPMHVRRWMDEFERYRGAKPTLEDLREANVVDLDGCPISEGKMRLWEEPPTQMISLDRESGNHGQDERGLTLHDVLSDDAQEGQEELIDGVERGSILHAALERLDDRDRRLVQGWADGTTLARLGRTVGLKTAEVQEALDVALARLKELVGPL